MAVIVPSQGTVTRNRVVVRPGVFVKNLTLSESVAIGGDWVDGEVQLNERATNAVRVELTGDHDAMISDGSVEVTGVTIHNYLGQRTRCCDSAQPVCTHPKGML